jgi:hypothetical protein
MRGSFVSIAASLTPAIRPKTGKTNTRNGRDEMNKDYSAEIRELRRMIEVRDDQLTVLYKKINTIEKYLGIKIDFQTFGVNKEEK